MEEWFWNLFLGKIYDKSETSKIYISMHYAFFSLVIFEYISNYNLELSIILSIFSFIARRILILLDE